MHKSWKMTETLANGYSSESTRREQSNEYQHDRVSMVFKNICVLELWTKMDSALKGLIILTEGFLCCFLHAHSTSRCDTVGRGLGSAVMSYGD